MGVNAKVTALLHSTIPSTEIEMECECEMKYEWSAGHTRTKYINA